MAQRRADHDAGNPPAAARVEDAGGELPMPPTPTLPPPGAEPPSPGGETLPALGRPGPSGASPEPRDEVPDGVAGGVDPPGPGRADGPPPALSWARTASPAAEEAVTLPPSLTPAALPPLPLPLTPRPGAGTLGGTPPPRPLLGAAAQRAIAPAGPAPIGPPARPQPAARPAEVPLLGERMPRLSVPPPPVEPPPAAVRTAVEAAVGADLGGVHVHRREAAAHAAAQLEAEAFTVGDDVHLPGRHGPLDSPPAASLLAHELTHVAQQRRLGAALPSESSDGGQRLEAEARSVQRAWESGTLPLAVRHEAGHGGDDPGTRGGDDTAHLIESMLQSGFATASADGLLHFSPPDLAGSGAAALPAGTGVQRAETSASSPAPAASGGAAGTGGDDAQLEDLAQRIYHHIRWRLRSELLVDRERAGLMTDLS